MFVITYHTDPEHGGPSLNPEENPETMPGFPVNNFVQAQQVIEMMRLAACAVVCPTEGDELPETMDYPITAEKRRIDQVALDGDEDGALAGFRINQHIFEVVEFDEEVVQNAEEDFYA